MKQNRSKSVKIGQVRPANRLEKSSGLPGKIGQNISELVKTGSKLGQIRRALPRNTKIPREEASKSQ